jgi:hypothetical protein
MEGGKTGKVGGKVEKRKSGKEKDNETVHLTGLFLVI